MAISSPEDVCNQALRAIGFGRAIGDLYEGSAQSAACLEIYGQTRDEILTQKLADDFARGNAALVLLKGPPPMGGYSPMTPWSPLYPPPGYLYEYAAPADMIELRALVAPDRPLPDFDPQPVTWSLYNDTLPIVSGTPLAAQGPPAKAILTNLAGAVAVYRRRVTNLLLWKATALDAFIARLAAKLASSPRLASSPDMMKQAPAEAVYSAQVARGHRG